MTYMALFHLERWSAHVFLEPTDDGLANARLVWRCIYPLFSSVLEPVIAYWLPVFTVEFDSQPEP
jgi:hypothetical protein